MMADHALRFDPPAVTFVDTTKGFGFFNPAHLRKSIKRTKVSSDDSPLSQLHRSSNNASNTTTTSRANNMHNEPSSAARFGTTLLRRALSTTTGRSNITGGTSTTAAAANRARDRYQRKQKHRSSMIDVMHGASSNTVHKQSYIPDRPQSTLLISSSQ